LVSPPLLPSSPTRRSSDLCDPRPPHRRPPSQDYIWSADSPLVRLPGITFTREADSLAGRFAVLAVTSQPVDYAGAVLTELARTLDRKSTRLNSSHVKISYA